jgi:hypothetical protein
LGWFLVSALSLSLSLSLSFIFAHLSLFSSQDSNGVRFIETDLSKLLSTDTQQILAILRSLLSEQPTVTSAASFLGPIRRLYERQISWIRIMASGAIDCGDDKNSIQNALILSGSFNPLHIAHVHMLEFAAAQLARLGRTLTPCFELSASNADKGFVEQETFRLRLCQFAGRFTVIGSNEALFREKMR